MATHNEVPPATTTAGSHPIESAHSSDGKTEFQGGTSLHNGPSVVDGHRYPRGGDYEAQYFDVKETPKFSQIARFGNPTGLPVAGFAISLLIASMGLLGFKNMQVTSVFADVGVFFFIGGMCMLVGGIFELLAGNSFAFVVFLTFSGYWFSFGSVFAPNFGVSANAAAAGALGADQQGVGLAFWQITYCILNFIYLLCSLRTNMVFVLIFLFLEPAFILLAVGFGGTGLAAATRANALQAAGAFGFVTALLGFYLLAAILMAEVGHGIKIPVGDLSGFWAKRDAKNKTG